MSGTVFADLGTQLKKANGIVVADVKALEYDDAVAARQLIWDNVDKVDSRLLSGRYKDIGVDGALCDQWIDLMLELDKKLD